jgi:hypothetical protein
MPYIFNKPPLDTGNVSYEIKDGILFIQRHKRAQYTLEQIKDNVRKRMEYTEGYSYPLIIFGKDMISMDKASRGFLGTDGAIYTISRAFVVEKAQGKLQLNFFMETTHQPVPTKIFDEMEPAIEWSKQFKLKVDL